MENLSRIFEEKQEEGNKFTVFFLKDDEDQSVLVEEIEETDLPNIIKRASLNGSIFITRKREPKLSTNSRKSSKRKKVHDRVNRVVNVKRCKEVC